MLNQFSRWGDALLDTAIETGKGPAYPARPEILHRYLHRRSAGSHPIAGLAEGDAHVVNNVGGQVTEDTIRQHPLVTGNIPSYGYIYDVKTGGLLEVPETYRA